MIRIDSKIIYCIIILFLSVIDVVLLFKFNIEKKEKIMLENRIKLISFLGFNKINRTSFLGWDDNEVKLNTETSVLTILIFFRPNDCPACIDTLVRWNNVKDNYYEFVNVIAISPEWDSEYYKELIQLYNIKYDLAKDEDCSIFRYLSPEIYTPVAVYLNNKGEVIGFDIIETLPKSQEILNEHINKYIQINTNK